MDTRPAGRYGYGYALSGGYGYTLGFAQPYLRGKLKPGPITAFRRAQVEPTGTELVHPHATQTTCKRHIA